MFKPLMNLLQDIKNVNWDNGDTPTESYLKIKGHKKEVIDKADELELIDFWGTKPGGQAGFFQLTKKGYEFLQIHINSNLNREMLRHTKVMKNLTWVILGFTLINMVLIGTQIYLILK